MRRVIFLDRDGTINIEKSYLHKWEDFEFEKNAIEGLKALVNLGYELVIVTNQSGIARGYYSEEELKKLNNEMMLELKKSRINILDCYYCPHHPEKGLEEYKKECNCRKPSPGMLLDAKEKYGIDMSKSFMIGDKYSDLKAGENAGVKSILVKTGYGRETLKKYSVEYMVAEDLLEAAQLIEKLDKQSIN